MSATVRELSAGVAQILDRNTSEVSITQAVASLLAESLSDGLAPPEWAMTPNPSKYIMYPLYIAESDGFCIASAVWNVGQRTPIHGHETWGVVGIYAGQEGERRFDKPHALGHALRYQEDRTWSAGEVTVCCTHDNDVHEVWCEGEAPAVGIHIYGADIGKIRRPSYNPETGDVTWFITEWGPTPSGYDSRRP